VTIINVKTEENSEASGTITRLYANSANDPQEKNSSAQFNRHFVSTDQPPITSTLDGTPVPAKKLDVTSSNIIQISGKPTLLQNQVPKTIADPNPSHFFPKNEHLVKEETHPKGNF